MSKVKTKAYLVNYTLFESDAKKAKCTSYWVYKVPQKVADILWPDDHPNGLHCKLGQEIEEYFDKHIAWEYEVNTFYDLKPDIPYSIIRKGDDLLIFTARPNGVKEQCGWWGYGWSWQKNKFTFAKDGIYSVSAQEVLIGTDFYDHAYNKISIGDTVVTSSLTVGVITGTKKDKLLIKFSDESTHAYKPVSVLLYKN